MKHVNYTALIKERSHHHVAALWPYEIIHKRHNIGLGVSKMRGVSVLSFASSDRSKRMSHAWKRREYGSIFKGFVNFRREGLIWLIVSRACSLP